MNKQLVKAYAKNRGISPLEAEGEILEIIQRVAKSLAPLYKFGYHSTDDLEQQGMLFALEILDTPSSPFDPKRPLENFLAIHVRNRLSNYRRDNYIRFEAPCTCCDPFNPPASPCKRWLDWSNRNLAKQNLMKPLDMSNIADDSESNMHEKSEVVDLSIVGELRSLLDRELPVELRKDYLQMLDGKILPRARREKVRGAVLTITRRNGYATEEDYTD